MRSGMGSFNKFINRLKGSVILFLVIFLFSLPAIIVSRVNAIPVVPVSDRVDRLITDKLKRSLDQSDSSLEEARETCLEALSLCKKSKNDTLNVNALLQLGDIVSLQGENNEALSYFEEALKISETVHYAKGECNALLEAGTIHYVWGEYDRSYSFFKKALEIAVPNQFSEQHAGALNMIGKYYHTTGKYDLSVRYYQKAADVARQMKDSGRSVTLFLNIGKTYISEENIYMTLKCYLEAYDMSERSGDRLQKADVYNHLGSIYLLLKQPEKSLEYHHQAFKIRERMNVPQALATSCNNLGETFLYLSDFDSAAFYLRKSYELCLLTRYRKGTVKALTNLGRVSNETGKLSEARNFLVKALALAKEAGYNAGIVESSLALGENYLLKKEYNPAIQNFELSLSRMLPANLNEFQVDAYQGLYHCYFELGDYLKALDYHVKLNQADRRALLAQSNRQLAELRVSFDLERKESDNQKLRQQNELEQLALTKRAWIIWSVVIILVFTIILCILIYSRYVQKRRAHTALQRLIAELELANKEKDNMFSIIAHELRNPLYWFQNLTEVLSKNHARMSPAKLQKSLLSIDESAKNAFHLMDNLLNWSRTRLNRIIPRKSNHDLTGLVQETLRMFETIMTQKEIVCSIMIPRGTLICADADMFNCILRNLVSNAIKYTPVKGQIRIEVSAGDELCTLQVCDSGIGMSSRDVSKLFSSGNFNSSPGLMNEKGSGLGLKLCKEFTRLNGGEIWVSGSENQGTCFSFTVPLGK